VLGNRLFLLFQETDRYFIGRKVRSQVRLSSLTVRLESLTYEPGQEPG